MTTSRTDEPTVAPPPVAAGGPADAGAAGPGPAAVGSAGPSGRRRPAGRRAGVFGLAALVLDREQPYFPFGDQAILALSVDAVGEHEVLLGAYSRFGWYHPGPMATYLLAGVSVPDGRRDQALAVGALVVGGLASAGAVWLVRRRAGALRRRCGRCCWRWPCACSARDFLRDSWNPFLPVLPLLAGVLLCWTAVRGDAWALPLAVVPLSLAVQAHVGYLPPVGAVAAVLVAGCWSGRCGACGRGPPGRGDGAGRSGGRRWLVAGVAALGFRRSSGRRPSIEQRTGTPGNAQRRWSTTCRRRPRGDRRDAAPGCGASPTSSGGCPPT